MFGQFITGFWAFQRWFGKEMAATNKSVDSNEMLSKFKIV